MDAALIAAGSLALAGAVIQGLGGELLVVRRLSVAQLPSSRFGGPRMTRTMIHVAWHIATVAFATVGGALVASGAVLDGEVARGIALVAATAMTGFAAVVLVLGGAALSPRALFRHPGPIVLSSTAALAWVGAL